MTLYVEQFTQGEYGTADNIYTKSIWVLCLCAIFGFINLSNTLLLLLVFMTLLFTKSLMKKRAYDKY